MPKPISQKVFTLKITVKDSKLTEQEARAFLKPAGLALDTSYGPIRITPKRDCRTDLPIEWFVKAKGTDAAAKRAAKLSNVQVSTDEWAARLHLRADYPTEKATMEAMAASGKLKKAKLGKVDSDFQSPSGNPLIHFSLPSHAAAKPRFAEALDSADGYFDPRKNELYVKPAGYDYFDARGPFSAPQNFKVTGRPQNNVERWGFSYTDDQMEYLESEGFEISCD